MYENHYQQMLTDKVKFIAIISFRKKKKKKKKYSVFLIFKRI